LPPRAQVLLSEGPSNVDGVLHLHRSERADLLLASLAGLLSKPLGDPMAREVVAVPTRGVERWLAQSLSHHLGATASGDDGVSANIDWPFPGALVYMATAAACGIATGDQWRTSTDNDPWSPGRLVWPLVQIVDESLDEDFLSPLASHLRAACGAGEGEAPRRFAAVRHIADLFDSYSVHRPEMVLSWLEDELGHPIAPPMRDTGPEALDKGAANSGAWGARQQDIAWQAELFRRARQRLGVPCLAERLTAAPGILAGHPELLPLPERLSVFGLTRLPESHLSVLRAIAANRDVHLFLLHPSGALWDKVAAELSSGRMSLHPLPSREEDGTARLPRNPLLRNWARDAREMQLVLASQGAGSGEHLPVEAHTSPQGASAAKASLLRLLQDDIRADRDPPGPALADQDDLRPVLSEDDKSLQVHACHGRARQVEVVREAVLHLLAEDPSLEPRDVIVMCPDIELFAPLVTATFGPPGWAADADASGARGPLLRARLADRSLRQTNPLLAVAARLLELTASRLSAPDVFDFASAEPVRRRFELKEEELARVEEWISETGTRWGFDAEHRQGWKLGSLGQLATWRSGLDRLLLGVAMAGSPEPFGGLLALEDVPSTDIDLAGRFAEFLERLHEALVMLSAPQSVRSWAEALVRGTESLACADESWQHDELQRVLDDVAALAEPPSEGWPQPPNAGATGQTRGAGPAPLLDLAEVTYLLADRLRGRPTRANFRTGDVTICTLVPMRSVPHRVVCLLGLDGAVFPRRAALDGDDLLLASPRVGDRDGPSEDRQLLLDALLAAKDHLVVTYEGRDQRQNLPVPPAVPVAELLDVVDRTVRHPNPAKRAREMVLVEHPLQAFDPRNYTPGALRPNRPWRFDKLNLDGALAIAGERRHKRPFLDGPLSWQRTDPLQLRSLKQFLDSPVREFLKERLGIFISANQVALSDRLPLQLDALGAWALGDRLLRSVLAGKSLDEAVEAENGRGLLPPGALGEEALEQARGEVSSLLCAAQGFPEFSEPATSVDVNVVLPDGLALVGTVPDVHGRAIVVCTYSKLRAKNRLQAWLHLLALSAAHPDLAPRAVTIARSRSSRASTATQVIGPLGCNEAVLRQRAMEDLSVLVDLYDRGMCEPLPLYCETSAAWALARRCDEDARARAAKAWGPSYGGQLDEASAPEHLTVLGKIVSFDELLRELPAPTEDGPGWPTEERTRFGRLAVRLWAPLLDEERLDDPAV
jgi:exodeoxyribonuclease V gamma subunit